MEREELGSGNPGVLILPVATEAKWSSVVFPKEMEGCQKVESKPAAPHWRLTSSTLSVPLALDPVSILVVVAAAAAAGDDGDDD